jgi:ribokinase
LADLRRDGIDVSLTLTQPGVTSGIALIAVDTAGENEIVMIPGANDLVSPGLAEQAVASVPADVLSLTLEIPLETVRAALLARPAGMRAVLNAAVYDPGVKALAHLIDVLIVNEAEAGAWLGWPVSPATAGTDVRRLADAGPELAIITLGSAGAYFASRSGHAFHQPAVQVDVVDTTGAGDAFCGACAAWLANDTVPETALRAGVAAGALAVGVAGAQPSLPYVDQINALLSRLPSAIRLS